MSEVQRPTFAQDRRQRLLQLLRTRGSISVSTVAAELNVSEPTVRRDVNALARKGLLTRVHGGATLLDHRSPFSASVGDQQPKAPTPQRRFTVGMMVPSFSYYWPSIIAGARAAATAAGVRLVLRSTSHDLIDNQKQIEILAATPGIDGMIVAPALEEPNSPQLLQWIQDLPLPVLLAERRPPDGFQPGRLEWVVSDHAAGAAMAVQHLHAEGHRKIGLYMTTSPTAAPIRHGWQEQLRSLGIDPTEQLTGPAQGFTRTGRDAVFDDLLAECRRTQTTALLVHPDSPAQALVQHCHDVGYSVPTELAVVSYDDEVAHLGQPAITAVRPPKQHLGRLAVELMVSRLVEGQQRPAHRVTISPTLNIRASSVSDVSRPDALLLEG